MGFDKRYIDLEKIKKENFENFEDFNSYMTKAEAYFCMNSESFDFLFKYQNSKIEERKTIYENLK